MLDCFCLNQINLLNTWGISVWYCGGCTTEHYLAEPRFPHLYKWFHGGFMKGKLGFFATQFCRGSNLGWPSEFVWLIFSKSPCCFRNKKIECLYCLNSISLIHLIYLVFSAVMAVHATFFVLPPVLVSVDLDCLCVWKTFSSRNYFLLKHSGIVQLCLSCIIMYFSSKWLMGKGAFKTSVFISTSERERRVKREWGLFGG